MKEKIMKKILKFLNHPVGITCYLFLMIFIQRTLLSLNFALGLAGFAVIALGTLVLFVSLDSIDEKERKKILKEEYEIIENETKDLSKEKQKELENILDSRLNDIKREKEELQNLREILNNTKDLVDITNVYVFEHDSFKNIVDLKEINLGTANLAVKVDLYDIFSKNKIDTFLGKRIGQIENYGIKEDYGKITKIEKVEPALLAYPSKLVPKSLLQEIYYNVNNIDISAPILRKRIEHNKK